MKVLKSSHINPFGGLNFVLQEFETLKIGQLLESNLPELPVQSKYTWKDILYAFWSIYFCGGDCIEDIQINLGNHLRGNPIFNIPSSDRLLSRFKELAIPKDIFTAIRGTRLHQFSLHPILNELNLKLLIKTGLKPQDKHILDYDNTIIYTNKSDSIRTYKKEAGYCPGVGIIGNNIVFVENRNGNSGAKDLQLETLTRMFCELKEQNIKIDAFRADSASYQVNVIDLITKHCKRFFLKAVMSHDLAKQISKIDNWHEFTLGTQVAYRGEIKFTPFIRTYKRSKQLHKAKGYRLVVTKSLREDKQVNMFTKDAYLYSAILTNDFNMTSNEIVYFYNQRGAIEKEFDILKNDFGWNNLPFSKLEQNTVFMLFAAMCRNLYRYVIEKFSKKVKALKPSFRIKKFIFRFITTPAKWIKTSRQYKLKIYGNVHFKT